MRLIGKALWRGRLSEWGILHNALDIPFIRALTAVADCGRVKSMKENPCGGTLRTLPFRPGDSPALDTVSCRGLFLLHGVSVGGCFFVGNGLHEYGQPDARGREMPEMAERGDIVIRDARSEDAPRLVEIYDHYVRHTAITFEYETPSVDEFRERMRRVMARYPYLVAERDGVVQGYAYAGAFHPRAAYDWCCELTVYVARDTRRCGMGRRLYEALEQALREMGVCNLYACIACPEQEDEYLTRSSMEFHEHLGFRQAGLFRECGYKFGRWYHMVWMEKFIGAHRAAQPPVRPYRQ